MTLAIEERFRRERFGARDSSVEQFSACAKAHPTEATEHFSCDPPRRLSMLIQQADKGLGAGLPPWLFLTGNGSALYASDALLEFIRCRFPISILLTSPRNQPG